MAAQGLTVPFPNPYPGTITIDPPYAGSSAFTSALTINAPSPLTGSRYIGFTGIAPLSGELEIISTGTDVNTLGITTTNINGGAIITCRGPDTYYTDTTTVFEHFAFGWYPQQTSKGAVFLEASRFDGALNPLIVPPEFVIYQTGGVDPTGGTNVANCVTNGTTAITSVNNMGANGTLITGTGIPAATTVVSGGGTGSIIASKAATASGTVTLNFSSPVYAQYNCVDFSPQSDPNNIDFRSWSGSPTLSIDRVNTRVGINQPFPAYTLDVNGDEQIVGTLRFSGGGTISGGGGAALSLTGGSHVVQHSAANASGGIEILVANTSTGASVFSEYLMTTGTANSSALFQLLDQSGSPLFLFAVGSAVANTLWRAPQFTFQSQSGGVTVFEVVPSTGGDFLYVSNGTTAGVLSSNAGDITLNAATGVTNVSALKAAGKVTTGAAVGDVGYGYNAPVTGATVTLAATTYHQIIDPAGTIAALTINMTPSPFDGQMVDIKFSQIVTVLTISGNGNTLVGAPTSTAVGTSVTGIYRAANTTWYF
jgi:hypothetical protein